MTFLKYLALGDHMDATKICDAWELIFEFERKISGTSEKGGDELLSKPFRLSKIYFQRRL